MDTMALDPRRPLADHEIGDAFAEGASPHMLRQPVDPPIALGHAADIEPVRLMRQVWKDQVQPSRSSWRRSLRVWLGRVSGRSDRRMILALAGAVDAIASHCDRLVDGLASQDVRTAETAGAFGEDITHLRAEVAHLQGLAASLNLPRDE
jgi:hypothetical protein